MCRCPGALGALCPRHLGEVLSIRERDFVAQARIAGSSFVRIMMVHLFPMYSTRWWCLPLIGWCDHRGGLVELSWRRCASANANLGLDDRRRPDYIASAWWVSFFPGLAILVTVLAFNLFGDYAGCPGPDYAPASVLTGGPMQRQLSHMPLVPWRGVQAHCCLHTFRTIIPIAALALTSRAGVTHRLRLLGAQRMIPWVEVPSGGIKQYQIFIYDYLVGCTDDGQLSADHGIAQSWRNQRTSCSGRLSYGQTSTFTMAQRSPLTTSSSASTACLIRKPSASSAQRGRLSRKSRSKMLRPW